MSEISIIIPTLNEEAYLPILLVSIVEQDYDGKFEVIIVDGGSTDNTLQVAKKFQSKLPNLFVYSYKKGTSRQRNHGAKKALYDNLVFLDADMKLNKGTLRKLSTHFDVKDNFTATPILFPYNPKWVDYLLGIAGYAVFLLNRYRHPITSGMCIITTKSVHSKIDGFNESVSMGEDIDYGLRAHKSGATHYIFFDIIVRGSPRRLNKMGRLKVARTWSNWYNYNIKNGPILDGSNYDYEFGKFKND
jgi:glycosyltransferase involved in cell wall biosynthesis